MKGGFNNPPNAIRQTFDAPGEQPSMKGGFNNPPNTVRSTNGVVRIGAFNEGGVQ